MKKPLLQNQRYQPPKQKEKQNKQNRQADLQSDTIKTFIQEFCTAYCDHNHIIGPYLTTHFVILKCGSHF